MINKKSINNKKTKSFKKCKNSTGIDLLCVQTGITRRDTRNIIFINIKCKIHTCIHTHPIDRFL